MNILFCGDANARDGVLASTLSLLANQNARLDIHILTAKVVTPSRTFSAIDKAFASGLREIAKALSPQSSVRLFDATDAVEAEPPSANLETRFTPCCMLRLYADEALGDLDGKRRILYLDNDVLCRRDISALYRQDMGGAEIGGVLDRYGRWFFRREARRQDYLNSGVLLMDMERIAKTGLLRRCRELCASKRMFMPDQSALNKLASKKFFFPRRFNEQGRLRSDTCLQHFSTRFSPRGIVSVKPWDIDAVHDVLKVHEYDDVLEAYRAYAGKIIQREEPK